MDNPIVASTEAPPVTLPPAGQPPEKPTKSSFLDGLAKIKGAEKPPQTPPTEKPVADKPAIDPEDAPVEIKSDKGKSDWKKIKEAREAAEARAKEFETKYSTETATLKEQLAAKEKEIAEARAAFDPAEVERLRAEHKAVNDELKLLEVTRSPEWKQHFVVPVEKATAFAVSLIPEESKAMAQWYLTQPDSPQRTEALEQLMAGLGPLKVGQFANAITTIDSTRARASELLADNAGLVERYQKGKQTERESQALQERVAADKEFKAVRDRVLAAKMPWSINESDSEKAASEGMDKARSYFEAADAPTKARVATWAAYGEAAYPQMQALMKELADAKAAIAKLSSAGTKPPSGTGGAAPTAAPKGGAFMAAIRGQG